MAGFLTEVKGFTPVIDVVVQDVGLVAAAVYGVMWRYCQMEDQVCKATLATIAERVGIDRRTVIRHIAVLTEAGYVLDTTPNARNTPHIYVDAGKARIAGLLAVTESHSTEQACSDKESLQSDRKSLPAVTESHLKIPSLRENEETSEPAKTPAAPAPAPASTPPTPKPRRKSQKKPRTPTPPAIRVFRENAHRYPARSWYDDVAQAVGDDPGDLELWGKVVHAWVGMSWKPTNVKGMLEFYRRREIPGDGKGRGNANSLRGRPAGFIGSTATALDYNDPTSEEIADFQAAVDDARARRRREQAASAPS